MEQPRPIWLVLTFNKTNSVVGVGILPHGEASTLDDANLTPVDAIKLREFSKLCFHIRLAKDNIYTPKYITPSKDMAS